MYATMRPQRIEQLLCMTLGNREGGIMNVVHSEILKYSQRQGWVTRIMYEKVAKTGGVATATQNEWT